MIMMIIIIIIIITILILITIITIITIIKNNKTIWIMMRNNKLSKINSTTYARTGLEAGQQPLVLCEGATRHLLPGLLQPQHR